MTRLTPLEEARDVRMKARVAAAIACEEAATTHRERYGRWPEWAWFDIDHIGDVVRIVASCGDDPPPPRGLLPREVIWFGALNNTAAEA